MSACAHVCVHVCVRACANTCKSQYTRINTNSFTLGNRRDHDFYGCVFMFVCTCTRTSIPMYACAHIYNHMYTHRN